MAVAADLVTVSAATNRPPVGAPSFSVATVRQCRTPSGHPSRRPGSAARQRETTLPPGLASRVGLTATVTATQQLPAQIKSEEPD